MRRLTLLPILLAFSALPPRAAEADDFFSRKIAPVLQKHCLSCHNPTKSRGDFDLSNREKLLQGGVQGSAVIPGKSGASLLVEMVSGDKPKMPRQGEPLSKEQVNDLRKWIDDGAPWPANLTLDGAVKKPLVGPDWWALRPLTQVPVPAVKDPSWARTPIDAFILARLEAQGLRPSAPADRRTLIRRVTFDLHGLPPTPEETDAFVNDARSDAYERLVDHLLASPRYGERWGRHWLDVVHYGDTHGYDKDKRRDHAWPYRDYVIRAFNHDKPYARFIKEQVAGDVLFPADPEALIATGFVAAGPWDFVGHVELREGTVDKLKTRLLDRDDMVSNTISTFMSLTVHCARCHDHKFDPIPQKDYYRLQAVFAGVERGNRPTHDRQQAEQRLKIEEQRKTLAAQQASLMKKSQAQASPELTRLDEELRQLRAQLASLPAPTAGRPSSTNGYHSGISRTQDATKWVQVDLGKSVPLDAIHLVPARPTDFRDAPGFGFPLRFRIDLSDDPTFARFETVVDHLKVDYPNPGATPYRLRLTGKQARYVRVTAERLWLRTNDYVFALAELQAESGGKNLALGATVTALDSIEAGRWSRKNLVDNFDSRTGLADVADPKVRRAVEAQARLQEVERQRQAKAEALLDPATRANLQKLERELAELDAKIKAAPPGPQVYTVLPRPPRPIHVLPRGNVETPGEQVEAGGLTCVPGLSPEFTLTKPEDEGSRRGALAEWIADPRNVLTWRSIVNRVWHYHFGRGLVDTPNDFGYNGARPTHPELLDWLAFEFQKNGGSIKQLHRLILLSSTYRQSTQHHSAHAKIDADNRFLWRMNRLRLDAESIRDTVLAVSGKLDLKMGGPGYDLFRFKDDHSPVYDHTALEKIHDLATYRRTVYRFTVRSVPNPFLDSLDCADPNLNIPVRNTTLTALQALALLNDPFMIKQAEHFADRLQKISSGPSRQIEAAYRLALGRMPSAEESAALVEHRGKHGLANACRLLFNVNEFIFID